ncbi:subtilisin-like serine protease [Halogeometricum borinquense DSM 11551]|uniref:Subtilisin-like serine protease n=3 Tax=Halogeometricum borinquense TaxID=60847 RepID=L9V3E9_HALBP|nr:subtilisin-like serine protease [Halogeometricum borinquense DSM 11551]
MLHELAAGSIFIIQGPEDMEGELESIPAVNSALSNQTYTIETSELQADKSIGDATTDSLTNQQYAMKGTRAFEAHDITTGSGIIVAVVDTGIDHTHPDLESQLDQKQSRLFRNSTVLTGTEKINVPTELEPVERFVATDIEGHSTQVAGIVAASQNETGIVGVAPDAKIISLRPFFFDELVGDILSLTSTFADLLVAIDYAIDIGVDVVNVSLTVGDPDPGSISRRRVYAALNRIIVHAIENGTTVVAAMGNDGIKRFLRIYPSYQ